MNVTGNSTTIRTGNLEYTRESLDARLTDSKKTKEISKVISPSTKRTTIDTMNRETTREIKKFMSRDGVDPYDNTPNATKVPRDKVMALTNGQYTASLLEKILKATDNSDFQSATLKFQEQTLNYMQSISTDIKAIAESIKNKEQREEESEDNDLKMEMSNLAKALSEVNIENIAKEIGKSIYTKMDSSGYGDLVKTMYQSLRDTVQGGDFTQMVKGMIQNTMLKQLPREWQQTIQDFRDDPVKLMQRQVNKLASSNNRVLRDIFGSSYRGMRPDTTLKEKQVDLSAKAMFDNKFYMSVTRIIPEQLYRIVAALEGTEIRAFDWNQQKYRYASELAAEATKNNYNNSFEALQDKTMAVFSYMFEQAFEKNRGGLNQIFKTDAEGKLIKDQITGHVQFSSSKMKELLTKIMLSDIDRGQIASANPAWVARRIGINTNDPVELGQVYNDIAKIQMAIKMSDFEDRNEVMDDLEDLKTQIHNRYKDNRTSFLTPTEQAFYDRLFYNNNMTAQEKKDLLNAIGKQGIHTWGAGGVYGPTININGGSSNGPMGPSINPSIQGANTITHYEYLFNRLNSANLSGRTLSDQERNKAMSFIDDIIAGKRTNYDSSKPSQLTPEQRYKAMLDDMYGNRAISAQDKARLSAYDNESNLSQADSVLFRNGRNKLRAALETYKILQEAGYTADAQAARLGVSVQEAQRMGYINSPSELMGAINNDGTFNPNTLRDKKFTYLMGDDFEYVKKVARDNKRGVLGNGSLDKQISNTLSGIFGDPQIAGKAGLAVGSAAGLGVAKLLKDNGIITSPRFGYMLAAVGGGLMSMQRTRNFMNSIFGPDGDVKGANGFTNKEIFLAKAMSKYLPAIGIGGKAATMIMKATSAFGPLGKAFGLIAGPILGYGIGMASSSLIKSGRDWLFNPERDPKSKIAKFANFLKDIPGVKKLFALSDTRSDTDLHVDGLRRLEQYYTSKLMSYKATENPSQAVIQDYQRAIAEIKDTRLKVERLQKDKVKLENSEEPDHERIAEIDNLITDALTSLDDFLDQFRTTTDIDGRRERQAMYEQEVEAQDSQNRMRAAADAKYNRPSEDHMERINDMVANYWDSSDEHKRSMREALSGEGDLIYDIVKNDGLKAELRTLVARSENGHDVSRDYIAWQQKFRQLDPEGYQTFLEATRGGSASNRIKEDIINELMRYMREEEHFTGTEEELRRLAQSKMIHYVNNRGIGKTLKNILGDATGDTVTRFKRMFNAGLDEDDIIDQQRVMDMINSLGDGEAPITPEEAMRNTRTSTTGGSRSTGSGRAGNVRGSGRNSRYNARGGRGSDPIKMRQLKDNRFKTGESLSIAGCSIAAITNALVYMGVEAPEPDTLTSIANKYLTSDGGITSEFFIEVCNKLGLSVEIFTRQKNQFTVDTFKYFKPGNGFGVVLLLQNRNSSGYHYVTVKSISGRKVVIDDPEHNGLETVTAADLVVRLVEIISIKTISQTSVQESNITKANKALIKSSKSNNVTLSESNKTVTDEDITSTKSSTTGGKSGVLSKISNSVSELIEALKNAVLNVRIVDDLTLPLKMGDPNAALAVSKAQIASTVAPGIKGYAQRIKHIMMNKDVQSELHQQDLVQDAILNGGLVAGGSTGIGGRGSSSRNAGSGAVYGGPGGGNLPNTNPADKPFMQTLKDKALQYGGLLGYALPAAGAWMMNKTKDFFIDKAKFKLGLFKNNLFNPIKDEDRQQLFDEEGNQISKGKFRDVGGSLRNLRDGINFVKGAGISMGAIGATVKNVGTKMAGSNVKLIQNMGKAAIGEGTNGILNFFVKACTDLPIWVGDKLLKSKMLSNLAGGEAIWKEMLDNVMGPIKKVTKTIADRVGKAFAAKGGKELAKKGILSKLKSLPGLTLITAIPGVVMSVYTGWREAHRYLGKKEENVAWTDRLLIAMAKMLWDNGPDILIGLMTVGFPPASILLSVLLAVFRSIFTFDDLLALFGVKNGSGDEEKIKQNESKAYNLSDVELNKKLDVNKVDKKTYSKNVQAVTTGNSFTARHEGFRSHTYRDSKGYETIGYGFNLESGRFSQEQVDRWRRYGISEAEAKEVLDQELQKSREQLEKFDWYKKLDPVRQGALLDMTYNMGIGWVDKFEKAVAALKSGDYERAADEILNSEYAKDVGIRANEVADLIRYGGGSPNSNNSSGGNVIPLSNGWGSPVKGEPFVTSAFGPRRVPGASNPHKGIDIRGKTGDPVFASKDGVVTFAGGDYNTILIQHDDGTQTRYMHNHRMLVKTGDRVKAGDKIATIGGTGPKGPAQYRPHLHFETLINGRPTDPFIELGLKKENLKLPPKYPESESLENIAYLQRNKWLEDQASKSVDSKLMAIDTSGVSKNQEAGGPMPYDRNETYNSSKTTVVRYEDTALRQYVINLDKKFDQMISLLTQLVKNTDENANNIMSEALSPARI